MESVLDKYKPQVAMELGSYIGYSAIVTARKLPAGAKLFGIELDPIVRVTRAMIQHTGLSDKIEIIEGTLKTSIPVSHFASVWAMVKHVAVLLPSSPVSCHFWIWAAVITEPFAVACLEFGFNTCTLSLIPHATPTVQHCTYDSYSTALHPVSAESMLCC